ncbi:MAG: FliG C-terminal domain-containing protein [Sedimentisphaerales bacterium]
MTLTGKQKAAMLLTSLDAVTAAELLKGVNHEVVQELAVELAYLDAAGLHNSRQSAEVASQFCNLLKPNQGFHLKGFLDTMLKSTVGSEKAKQIQTQIENLLRKRDPFMSIRSADSKTLASILGNEHPQAIAVVLSELPARKSSEVIGLLDEGARLGAISGMTNSGSVTAEAKRRIAEMVYNRLEAVATAREGSAVQTTDEQPLRKVAVILRNLGKELRDGLLAALQEKDSQAGEKVAELMVLWDDIPQVTDRSLQEALRGIDSQKLALSLVKADEVIVKKIKANISERAAAAIDEETSLMSAPKKEDIALAREELVLVLREMNKKGELNFIEE